MANDLRRSIPQSTTRQLILLELNEINFEYIRYYSERGQIRNFARLIENHGMSKTVSESRYEELEPWIQWVTAHTGLSFEQHGVFRLGDIVNSEIQQIWEFLAERGLGVGAISPMNAKNSVNGGSFFVPDPWTRTTVTGSFLLKRLHSSVSQAVNDNARARLTPASIFWLVTGAARYARPVNYRQYFSFATKANGKPWLRAMFLDLLLADLFIHETFRMKPNFATLFLNAGAHIQHHYMFNSAAYTGEQRNPNWYIADNEDPVGEVYHLYDWIISQIQQEFPRARIMIATGLHQDPHKQVTFYWRLKDHDAFLKKIGISFLRVESRMSRDFVVECQSEKAARDAESILQSAKTEDGVSLFEVDNRGLNLFVALSWPLDIPSGFKYVIGDRTYQDLSNDVAFVAIKNGQHNGIGYLIDTGAKPGDLPNEFSLREIPSLICGALGMAWN